jgi:hypothetical protein
VQREGWGLPAFGGSGWNGAPGSPPEGWRKAPALQVVAALAQVEGANSHPVEETRESKRRS